MTFHLRATGRHLPYGIIQCYLPPDTSERTPPIPSHAGWYSIYRPRRDGRLSWPSWLDSAPAGSRTSDLSITSPTLNRCTTKERKYDYGLPILNIQHCSLCSICKQYVLVSLLSHTIRRSRHTHRPARHCDWRHLLHRRRPYTVVQNTTVRQIIEIDVISCK